MYYENSKKMYSIMEKPLNIFGLSGINADKRQFFRLPPYMLEKMPQYEFLGKRSIGGRVRFVTNSGTLLVRMTLDACREDRSVPLSCSSGADIYLGRGKESVYVGYVSSTIHTMEEITVEGIFKKKPELEIVTINLPRNDLVLGMEIGIDENAVILEAPNYRISEPVVYYGSSITEGGCTGRVGNTYASIVSRWLDADFYNYGFSGSAKGEPEFAAYIASLPKISLLVYDYDYNAPDAEHLQNTHENFFKIIRRARPELPIVIMSRPNPDINPFETAVRKEIIIKTWQNAINSGDERVWFLDGGDFFGVEGRMECTVDGTHPNALGFMRMAEKIYPLLEQILGGTVNEYRETFSDT